MGLISYDDYSSQKSAETSRFFEVYESVVFDKKNALRYHFLNLASRQGLTKISTKLPTRIFCLVKNERHQIGKPYRHKSHYLKSVDNILRQIKRGSLLSVKLSSLLFSKDNFSNIDWLRKLYHNAGPYGAMLISYQPRK